MKVEQWPIEKVQPYPNNPKLHKRGVAEVAESIKRFGFRQPIVVDRDGIIIAGHARYEAAKALELKSVPVHVADLDDAGQLMGLCLRLIADPPLKGTDHV